MTVHPCCPDFLIQPTDGSVASVCSVLNYILRPISYQTVQAPWNQSDV